MVSFMEEEEEGEAAPPLLTARAWETTEEED